MKKVLFAILFMSLAVVADCQSFSFTATNPTGAILNTSIDTLTFTSIKDYLTVGVQPVVTRASGTMAGTVILAGSIDGINYVPLDTLTLTNAASNTDVFVVTSPVYNKYRLIMSGATTVTGTMTAKFSGRKPNS